MEGFEFRRFLSAQSLEQARSDENPQRDHGADVHDRSRSRRRFCVHVSLSRSFQTILQSQKHSRHGEKSEY